MNVAEDPDTPYDPNDEAAVNAFWKNAEVRMPKHRADETIPHEVIAKTIKEGMTPVRAWREHLQLTQAEVAERLGISQSAYAQQEAAEKPRKATREKIAKALEIAPDLLDF